jgi:hypothetical protein
MTKEYSLINIIVNCKYHPGYSVPEEIVVKYYKKYKKDLSIEDIIKYFNYEHGQKYTNYSKFEFLKRIFDPEDMNISFDIDSLDYLIGEINFYTEEIVEFLTNNFKNFKKYEIVKVKDVRKYDRLLIFSIKIIENLFNKHEDLFLDINDAGAYFAWDYSSLVNFIMDLDREKDGSVYYYTHNKSNFIDSDIYKVYLRERLISNLV